MNSVLVSGFASGLRDLFFLAMLDACIAWDVVPKLSLVRMRFESENIRRDDIDLFVPVKDSR